MIGRLEFASTGGSLRAAFVLVAAMVGLLAEGPVWAAPTMRYGGDATLTVWGTPPFVAPADLTGWGYRAISTLTYERLYRCAADGSLTPVLAAEAPRLDGDRLVIPLRSDVLRHDGKVLVGQDVARVLLSLRRGSRPGAYVLTPVKGHRDAIRGAPAELSLDLRAPYIEAARLLCAPHAAIAIRSPGGFLGTGPFRRLGTDGRTTKFVPFARHREGRPFLDEVKVRSLPDKVAAARAAARSSVILLGAPEAGMKRMPPMPGAPEELVVLVLGSGLNRAGVGPRLSEAIDPQRPRLAQKWRSVAAEPARCLVTDHCARPAGRSDAVEPRRVPLLVSSAARWRASFTSRVQVALAPLGLMAPIVTKTPADLAKRNGRPPMSAWLTSVVLPPLRDRFDRLHALFAIAAKLGRPDVLSQSEWGPVAAGRAPIEPLEEQVLSRMGLVPLVRVPVLDIVRSELVGLARAEDGILHLSDARIGRVPSP